MKIAFLTGSLSRQGGGFFPILQRLSEELTEHDCDVNALGTADADFAADQGSWRCRQTRAFKTCGPARLAYAPGMGPALVELNPDVVHLHGIWMAVSAVSHRWHTKTRRPYLISAQGMLNRWAIQHQNWKKKLAGWLYEGRNLRDAACLHALSWQEVEDYRTYGLTNPIAVIPNGVDLPKVCAEISAPPWQNILPGMPKVLLFLGRLHSKKGLLELLHAWKVAGGQRAGWHLAIAGWDDGGYEQTLHTKVKQLGLGEQISLVGSQFGTDKEACFENADAFILPSHSEGLPVAVLEAWAHRLPVVMTSQCNLPSGFEHGAAIRIAPEPNAIAEGLETLFTMSDAARVEMGRRGRKLVETSFSWPAVAEQMMATYRWMLDRGGPPPCLVT